MMLILDTHTFLWWDSQPANLSPRALALCQAGTNELILSVVSLWEIRIKLDLGKLTLPAPMQTIIDRQRNINGLRILPVELSHVLALEGLPSHHKDPFDRLL